LNLIDRFIYLLFSLFTSINGDMDRSDGRLSGVQKWLNKMNNKSQKSRGRRWCRKEKEIERVKKTRGGRSKSNLMKLICRPNLIYNWLIEINEMTSQVVFHYCFYYSFINPIDLDYWPNSLTIQLMKNKVWFKQVIWWKS